MTIATQAAARLNLGNGKILDLPTYSATGTQQIHAIAADGLSIEQIDLPSGAASSGAANVIQVSDGDGGFSAAGLIVSTDRIGISAAASSGIKFEGNSIRLKDAGGDEYITLRQDRIGMRSSQAIGWSNSATDSASTVDTKLYRDAAGQLALRNDANAQSFAVYSQYTDLENMERLRIYAQTGDDFVIQPEAGATTGTLRQLRINTDELKVSYKDSNNSYTGVSFYNSAAGIRGRIRLYDWLVENQYYLQITGSTVSNATIFASGTGQNFDHGNHTDPIVFYQSITAPNTDNTQWGANWHDQTDFNIGAGTGAIKFHCHASGTALTSALTEVMSVDTTAITLKSDPIIESPTVPSSASDTGTAGQVAWDASYVYVCTATDTWKRAAIATW